MCVFKFREALYKNILDKHTIILYNQNQFKNNYVCSHRISHSYVSKAKWS